MIKNVVKNLMYTNIGKIILSVLLGLGFATLFRQICNSKDCYRFIGPQHNALRDKIFASDTDKTKCYSLVEENIQCGSKSKTLDFSTKFM
jgi:hypothetical protein|uniref:Uncharacterized protein n=1 Tax=viral metagenome TaxID=1070528 RepID=A0A6C0KRX3_9ZZZZ